MASQGPHGPSPSAGWVCVVGAGEGVERSVLLFPGFLWEAGGGAGGAWESQGPWFRTDLVLTVCRPGPSSMGLS